MKQTLIVSSCVRGITVRCAEDSSGRSVRLEKTDTLSPISVWNFQEPPATLSKEFRSLWIHRNQVNLGRLLTEIGRAHV